MQFYYNPNKKSTAAHIWTGQDTACRMLSTGGIRPGKKAILPDPNDKRICTMCQSNYRTLMTERFGMSPEDAHLYLDMAKQGLHVHPVTLTAALVMTGDVDLKYLGETYERFVSETDGSVV